MIWIAAVAAALGAYLLGSFPSGFVVGKAKGVDLRKEGSGNIGATNALRVLGKKLGYLVFTADILKGWLGVMLARVIGMVFAPDWEIPLGVLGAICVFLGHIYPVWLGFKGGKGISTSGGIMLALFPITVFLCGLAIWLTLFYTTRYVSVASIGAAVALPATSAVLMLMGYCDPLRVGVAVVMCIIAVAKHRSNIERLMAGTEKRFEKKPKQSPV